MSQKYPHYVDNQGFCHQCGIVMDVDLLKISGYWREGMVYGKQPPKEERVVDALERREERGYRELQKRGKEIADVFVEYGRNLAQEIDE